MKKIVIIGAGQGGFQAAASLRQEGFGGQITLIGAEPGLPYQRPPLSKAYLKTGEADKLDLRPESFFEKNDIQLISGLEIEEIDRAAKQVRAGSQSFDYDHLILAVGTRNMRPPIPGLEAALDLRTLADAEKLRAALDRPMRCAVIGGGFIGLEFAAVARGLGHDVIVAEAAPRLMARAISPDMSQRFLEKHQEMGTKVLLGQPVAEVDGTAIVMADGARSEADLVLLAAGVVPNTELAAAAGLTVANGVVVNAQLLTDDPAISALGDCAVFPDPFSDRNVRLESVQAAADHARLIAKRLVHGSDAPYSAVPWFWSDQADWKLQIAGLSAPEDTSYVREDGAVFRFSGDVLSAVETINDAKTHMRTRKLMAGDQPITRAMIEQHGFDVGALL
jgi:3-phenylpropionate/trans-cinnamate dioxygenase ferredoxin reductase subunit